MDYDRKKSEQSVVRTRTWSVDMQKFWNLPVPDVETIEQRVARYTEYFSLKDEQVQYVCQRIVEEINAAAEIHKKSNSPAPHFKMLDTACDIFPTGAEKGILYTVEFSGTQVRAVRCKLDGNRRVTTVEHLSPLADARVSENLTKGLLDAKCGALELFDAIADAVQILMSASGDLSKKFTMPIAFVVPFPCIQYDYNNATLLTWTKGFETGRETADPVEGINVGTLLDMAFWRKDINARCVVVLNDSTAAILATEYERQPKLPPCVVSYLMAGGVNGAYVNPRYKALGYQGAIINTELGDYDIALPVTDVDLEVDYADQGGHGQQLLEKMIGGGYLGEVCRRLVVKVFQPEAPNIAWSRQSLPTAAAAMVVADVSPDLTQSLSLMKGLWDWQLSLDHLKIVKTLFTLVFDRSAALGAAVIAALAKSSGRLQPAMGGVTVALEGTFHSNYPWFTELIRSRLNSLLQRNASFVHLCVTHDATAKGAAILGCMLEKNI